MTTVSTTIRYNHTGGTDVTDRPVFNFQYVKKIYAIIE